MRRLRISAISYLNTAPLMWDFEHQDVTRDFEISYTIPSGCARALQDGTADIGIIPAAAYTTIPNLVILPVIAIAAKKAVRSILLVSKVPLEEAKSVALDTSSMTSVALAKVVFAKWLGGPRDYTPMPPELDRMLATCDAALLIGDPALQLDRSRYVTLDLAEEWNKRTGKSFVFAFWAVRRDAIRDDQHAAELTRIFRNSRDNGLRPQNLAQIAFEWAPRLALTEQEVFDYLTRNIHYELDTDCLEGLQLYYQYASEIGALPRPPQLQFACSSSKISAD
ncbi:MAG TPA: menaquinone biosynthesis protein [Terriglobales bacterium]|jgi:chorismate dehydratase|nr:menaquinone biosynthesis protein [Terriglobales bacterium]